MPSIVKGSSGLGTTRPSIFFRKIKGGLKIPRYMNTYRLESFSPFKVEVVDKILKDVMISSLDNIKYHPVVCLQICKDMSAKVCDLLFKKSYDRYKYTVIMTIVQKRRQGVDTKMACLWDANRDNYCTHVLESAEFIALGLVIATYYE
ncbi:PREDICTED: tctex1 domain-containing protein 1-like isoform X2 [Polistes dominula]|nr:PREDICTED: tctex1 domain-containing protein 1-like isoform X2 [Polistes dominula]